VKYDTERRQVYVTKDITFEPDETKSYEIKVKDVWHVKEAELNQLSEEARKMVDQLVGTDLESLATNLEGKIAETIEVIKESEAKELPLQERIGEFRENKDRMKKAEADWREALRTETYVRVLRTPFEEEYSYWQ